MGRGGKVPVLRTPGRRSGADGSDPRSGTSAVDLGKSEKAARRANGVRCERALFLCLPTRPLWTVGDSGQRRYIKKKVRLVTGIEWRGPYGVMLGARTDGKACRQNGEALFDRLGLPFTCHSIARHIERRGAINPSLPPSSGTNWNHVASSERWGAR